LFYLFEISNSVKACYFLTELVLVKVIDCDTAIDSDLCP